MQSASYFPSHSLMIQHFLVKLIKPKAPFGPERVTPMYCCYYSSMFCMLSCGLIAFFTVEERERLSFVCFEMAVSANIYVSIMLLMS